MRRMFRFVLRTVFGIALIAGTILLVRAFDARKMPEMKLWHRTVLQSEFSAPDEASIRSLDDFLALEDRVFAELRDRVYAKIDSQDRRMMNRFYAESPFHPERDDRYRRNWNRSFELEPAEVRGGVLMLHGLTDSCYSMRHLADVFAAKGLYAVCLRAPGHGTVPGALTGTHWEDWVALARTGARIVGQRIGEGRPFYLAGYSTGGVLAVQYTMDAFAAADLPVPRRLFLFSPAIGVSSFGIFASWNRALSGFQYFEKFKWHDIAPEYDPFKYNSFPKHAGDQVFRLCRYVQRSMQKQVDEDSRLTGFPPVLTFQSLVDSTVFTEDVVRGLYQRLPDNGSELVLFDINRHSALQPLIKDAADRLRERLVKEGNPSYTLTLVTNSSGESLWVVARTRSPGSREPVERALGLEWPETVYSLSHVAIPFPPEDPLYGSETHEPFSLGQFSPRGERDQLRVPLDQLMRLRHNPFFDYVKQRINETLASDDRGTAGR